MRVGSWAGVLVDGSYPYPFESGTDACRAALEWIRFHGLDPNRIPYGSTVVRDEVGRRILYTEFVMDEDGEPLIRDDEVVVVEKIEQGEAPPAPLPPEVLGA